jgi:hypothetical protein
VLRGEKPIGQVCRERQVTDALVYKGRHEFLDKAPRLFESKQMTASGPSEQAERIAELERLVGQLRREHALLKKGSRWLEAARRKHPSSDYAKYATVPVAHPTMRQFVLMKVQGAGRLNTC